MGRRIVLRSNQTVNRVMSQSKSYIIRIEEAGDTPAIESLIQVAFGPGAQTRAAFRIREQAPPLPALSFIGEIDGRAIASVRLTPVAIGSEIGLLLGPLVVDPAQAKQGYGHRLLGHAIDAAIGSAPTSGHRYVILVGDLSYYGVFGFLPTPAGRVKLPGPVDPARLLVLPLDSLDIAELHGNIRGIRD